MGRFGGHANFYLHKEIKNEGFVRSMKSYSRFLEFAGASNGLLLNFTQIGSGALEFRPEPFASTISFSKIRSSDSS